MAIQTALDPVADLLDEAKRVLPGGSFGNMPAEVLLRTGKGGRIWDEHGKEYVDFLLGSGPMFIGHAHPEVTAAVQSQLPHGSTYFGNNRHGIQLAKEIDQTGLGLDRSRDDQVVDKRARRGSADRPRDDGHPVKLRPHLVEAHAC